MVSAGGQVEGRVTQPVSLVRVGSVAEKHLDNIRIALNMDIGSCLSFLMSTYLGGSKMQGRPLVLVAAVDIQSASRAKLLHLVGVVGVGSRP